MPADDAAPVALRGDSKQLLAESGLTAGWLIETLIERNPEFKKALGGGTVEQVCTLYCLYMRVECFQKLTNYLGRYKRH